MNIADACKSVLAQLPDRSLIRIEIVYSDGFVRGRRYRGRWHGSIAVCAVASLTIAHAWISDIQPLVLPRSYPGGSSNEKAFVPRAPDSVGISCHNSGKNNKPCGPRLAECPASILERKHTNACSS